MGQDPRTYFTDNDLFDWNNLRAHALHHHVRIHTSKRFPDLALLHYDEECQWDKLWTAFAKMCRGLIVDMANKKILSLPYSKFHNMNEVPDTAYDNLLRRGPFEVSEKLDGSMLISFVNPHDKGIYLTTKGSFESEHGQAGTEWFRSRTGRFGTKLSENDSIIPEREDSSKNQYEKLVSLAHEGTLMFELIDSRFRIVIDYKKKGYQEGIYLIGYRPFASGRLLSYAEVASLAAELGLPCMKTYQYDSLDHLLKTTEDLSVQDEGFVIRYPEDGLMVKIKGLAYLKAHRFISQLSDKHILEAVAEGVADPLVEIAPEEYRDDVIEKIAYFKSRKRDLVDQCYQYFADAPKVTRKEFALWVRDNVKDSLRGCLFVLMDGKPLKDKDMYAIIKKYEDVSTETRI